MINFNPQISSCNKIGCSSHKHAAPAFGRSINNDTFVKSTNGAKNISFGGSMPLKRKFEMFQKDIEKYVLKSPKVELSEIEKIVQKYSPTTTVKSFDQIEQNSNAISTTAAYFQNQIAFTEDSEAIAKDKAIYIRPLNGQDKKSKLFFLDCLEHEFTHVLQEESKDRTSKVDFLNNYLKDKDIQDPKTLNTIALSPKVFSSVEHYVNLPFRKALNKSDNLPEKLPFYSKELVNQIYVPQTGMNVKDYIKTLINSILQEAEMQTGCYDKQQVVKYVALIANKEKEAYENSTTMLKKHLGINGYTDLDLKLQVYQIFEETAKEMSVKN